MWIYCILKLHLRWPKDPSKDIVCAHYGTLQFLFCSTVCLCMCLFICLWMTDFLLLSHLDHILKQEVVYPVNQPALVKHCSMWASLSEFHICFSYTSLFMRVCRHDSQLNQRAEARSKYDHFLAHFFCTEVFCEKAVHPSSTCWWPMLTEWIGQLYTVPDQTQQQARQPCS